MEKGWPTSYRFQRRWNQDRCLPAAFPSRENSQGPDISGIYRERIVNGRYVTRILSTARRCLAVTRFRSPQATLIISRYSALRSKGALSNLQLRFFPSLLNTVNGPSLTLFFLSLFNLIPFTISIGSSSSSRVFSFRNAIQVGVDIQLRCLRREAGQMYRDRSLSFCILDTRRDKREDRYSTQFATRERRALPIHNYFKRPTWPSFFFSFFNDDAPSLKFSFPAKPARRYLEGNDIRII